MRKRYTLNGLALIFALLLVNQGWAQITAQEAIKLMERGINLGNTLEPEFEGDWTGGLKAQESYFDMYKEAGFKTVRVPIRWDKHTATSSPFTIDPDWLDRVEEVMDWGLERDLFVIINMHHEDPFKNDYQNQYVRYDSIWSQISVRFKGKSEKLIFEMVNEPNGLTQEEIDEFNVRILNMIRKDNPTRVVIYAGNGWASSNDLINAAIPNANDPYLMAYYHSYDPWNFAGEGVGTWGSTANVNEMVAQMVKVQNWSIEKNIPVLIGEFGAQKKCEYNSRMFYYATYTEQALAHDLAFCVWDDNGDFQVMLRSQGKWNDIKDILIHTSDTSPTTLKAKMVEDTVVQLTWKSRLATKEQVFVERRTLSTDFTVIAEFGAVSSTTTVVDFNDTDVEDGKTYYYRVVEAVNGKSIPSYPVSITVAFPVVSVCCAEPEKFSVYPNPALNQINLSITGDKFGMVSLYNSNGQLIKTESIGAANATLNIENLEKGIYFIIAKTEKGLVKSTFIKQ